VITLDVPQATTAERKLSPTTPPSDNPISVSHEHAMLSAIRRRERRLGQPTRTRANPKRLLASLKNCSIHPLCLYQVAALLASLRLVASYQGSLGCSRRGFFARLLEILQHNATFIGSSRGRPW
jgi:hypothetical protein